MAVVPWVLVGLVMVGRVYVGAHNPLDVVCGAALGVAIGSGLNLVVGRPRRSVPYVTAAWSNESASHRRPLAPAAT